MMKKAVLLILGVAICGVKLSAAVDNPFLALKPPFEPTAEMLAQSDADAVFRSITTMASMDGLLVAIGGTTTQEERFTAMRQLFVTVVRNGTAFIRNHPDDPRRWRVVQILASTARELADADGNPKEELEGVSWDPAVFAEWLGSITALAAAAESAEDAPPEVRYLSEVRQPGGLRDTRNAVQAALRSGEPADFDPLKAELLRIGDKYPSIELLGGQLNVLISMREQAKADKQTLLADLRPFLDSPNASLRLAAQNQIDKLTAFDEALELSFTAVDGRQVDLKDYRGKVVLIDFWATWCGPCIAKIPYIKEVYEKYAEQGFAIIGVTLENARVAPSDSPEQAEAKHARAIQNLNNFTARNAMTWPQYYDGKHWRNEISTRLGVASIPALFLIDRSGRIASTDARGNEIEGEVRKLLGLNR